jgi:hypothetical protein
VVGNWEKFDQSKVRVGNSTNPLFTPAFQPRFVSKAVPSPKLEKTNAEIQKKKIMPVPDLSLRALCNF